MSATKIAYCTPSLYIPGGIERVLTTKANWLAEHGYDVTIILTDGKDKSPYYTLSPRINIIQLDINFEELWNLPFWKKIIVYLKKQRVFKRKLTEAIMQLKPDFTVSLLRREINFITSIKDGSRKYGEMHINKDHYRNFEKGDTNFLKNAFAKLWMKGLIKKLKKLDKLFVLSEEDKSKWTELSNVQAIPNPIPFTNELTSNLQSKTAISVGRYVHEKGFDMLLEAWSIVHKQYPEWKLQVYGTGDRTQYQNLAEKLGIKDSCILNGPTEEVQQCYANSSLYILSSRFEGFGMVIIEAMSCGLPVVSFDCPCGPRSIIKQGENGLLSPAEDPKALAKDICRVIGSKETMERLSKESKATAQSYTLDNIMKRWQTEFSL